MDEPVEKQEQGIHLFQPSPLSASSGTKICNEMCCYQNEIIQVILHHGQHSEEMIIFLTDDLSHDGGDQRCLSRSHCSSHAYQLTSKIENV